MKSTLSSTQKNVKLGLDNYNSARPSTGKVKKETSQTVS